MKRVVIAAPFGNYFYDPEVATSTLGTFTLKNRAGICQWYKWWRVLRTLRWYPSLQAHVNKLGLPNPGIEYLVKKVEGGYKIDDKIVSIHGFNEEEWEKLITATVKLKPLAVELNCGCPNVGDLCVSEKVFKYAKRVTAVNNCKMIVKLPPVRYSELLGKAYLAGCRIFNCGNTLPTPSGGLSGKPLKAVQMELIKEVRRNEGVWLSTDLQTLSLGSPEVKSPIEIIACGGITSEQDVKEYLDLGVDRVSVASMLFTPTNWIGWVRRRRLKRFGELVEQKFEG